MSRQSPAAGSIGQAAAAIIFGSSILGLTDNFIFILYNEIGLWQFQGMRGFIGLCIIAAYARLIGVSVWPKNWRPVLLRSLSMVIAVLLFFGALPLTGVAVAGGGMFTAPIFVLIISVLFFHERIGIRRIIAVIIGSVGVLLILDIRGDGFSLYALMPVLAGAFYGIGHIATRRLCADETTISVLFVYTLMITIVGLSVAVGLSYVSVSTNLSASLSTGLSSESLYLLRGWSTVSWFNLGVIALNALGATVALLAMAWGYQQAETSYVAIYEYSYLVFGGFFGWLLWQDMLSARSLAGIVFIVLAGAIISVRSGKSAKP